MTYGDTIAEAAQSIRNDGAVPYGVLMCVGDYERLKQECEFKRWGWTGRRETFDGLIVGIQARDDTIICSMANGEQWARPVEAQE